MTKVFNWIKAAFNRCLGYFKAAVPIIVLVWRASPITFVWTLCLTIVVGLSPLFVIYVTSALLDVLATDNFHLAESERGIPASFILLLCLVVGSNLFTQISQLALNLVRRLQSAYLENYIQGLIAERAVTVDLAKFESPTFQNHLQVAANESAYRPLMFVDGITNLLSMIIMVVSFTIILLLWQPWMVPLIFLASILTLYVSARYGIASVKLSNNIAETERAKFYLLHMFTSLEAAKEIRLFGLQRYMLKKFQNILESVFAQNKKLWTGEVISSGIATGLVSLLQASLIGFTALQAFRGILTVGQFNFYYQTIAQLSTQAVQIMSQLGELHMSKLHSANLLSYLALEESFLDEEQVKNSRAVRLNSPNQLSLKLENVSFSYPSAKKLVLNGINLEIKSGETVALVGDNGAGKTSLVKLITGLYTPTDGKIFLNNIDIQTISPMSLRENISVVFQDFNIFHLSLYENIAMGNIDKLDKHECITEAARRSGVDGFVGDLVDGYDTILGRFWDKGHELSGGQKQLVAVARSLLRNAHILILDEPSAALDVFNEQQFFDQLLQKRSENRSQIVIFISHRFSTVRRADRILVFQSGRLTEQGTHEELIQLRGYYAEMFNSQARFYD